ncbi:MAG: hypothetical protein WBP54_06555 [Pelodictyon phaeoclathratiforme]
MTEQGEKIAQFIQKRSEKVLRETTTEVLHRQPTATEWNIAMTSFFMGAACTASEMIEGFEKINVARN